MSTYNGKIFHLLFIRFGKLLLGETISFIIVRFCYVTYKVLVPVLTHYVFGVT